LARCYLAFTSGPYYMIGIALASAAQRSA